jgi:endoglucanase
MQKASTLVGATLVALLSIDCAASGGADGVFTPDPSSTGPTNTVGNNLGSHAPAGDDASTGNPASSGDPATGDDASTTAPVSPGNDTTPDAGTTTPASSGSTSNPRPSGGGKADASAPSTPSTPSTPSSDSGSPTSSTIPYRGLSLAGAEFGVSVSGQFNGTTLGQMPGDYYYPSTDLSKGGPSWPTTNGTAVETDLMDLYFVTKGINTIRLPFRWERLQHSLSSTSASVLPASQVVATFDATELAALKASVKTLTGAGYTVLVDVHNYAWYTSASEIASGQGGDPLGSANVPNVAFENLWIGLASLWPNDPKVVFDIMNEPNSPPDPSGKPSGYEWYLAAQAAVTGIRGAGANNLVLICGNNYADPGTFTSGGSSDPLKDIQDPASNFAFEVHDYPDNAYGTSDTCTTGSSGSIQATLNGLQTFVTWAQKYGARGFLGEFSAGVDVNADANCESAITQMLTLVQNNASIFLGWTYWAGGAGFGSNEPMNYPFFNGGKDSPQLQTLAPFLK